MSGKIFVCLEKLLHCMCPENFLYVRKNVRPPTPLKLKFWGKILIND